MVILAILFSLTYLGGPVGACVRVQPCDSAYARGRKPSGPTVLEIVRQSLGRLPCRGGLRAGVADAFLDDLDFVVTTAVLPEVGHRGGGDADPAGNPLSGDGLCRSAHTGGVEHVPPPKPQR
jgi:hypothetical protein